MSQGFTPEQLAALDAALAKGLKRVEHKGKVMEFQTIDQMLSLRDRMVREVNTQPEPRVMSHRANFGRS